MGVWPCPLFVLDVLGVGYPPAVPLLCHTDERQLGAWVRVIYGSVSHYVILLGNSGNEGRRMSAAMPLLPISLFGRAAHS